MIGGKLNYKLTNGLRAVPLKDMSIARSVATLIALAHMIWVATKVADLFQLIESGALIDWSIPLIHIRVALALIINTIGLWSRRGLGLLISVLALVWIGIEYICWYDLSLKIRKGEGWKYLTHIPSVLNLYGATRWNIVVMIVAAILLFWELRILIRIFKLSGRYVNE